MIRTILSQISILEIFSAALVMFAIIDITGSIPVFIGMKEQNKTIKAGQACFAALVLFVSFFFMGDALLRLFSVDIESFAIAGSFVLFILAVEMILGREIIKNENIGGGASIVPVAFPLIAGPGALTALLALKAEYAVVNIMLGLLVNLIIDFMVIHFLDKLQKSMSASIIFICRKFFGVILVAMAVKLFFSNLAVLIGNLMQH